MIKPREQKLKMFQSLLNNQMINIFHYAEFCTNRLSLIVTE